jgi:hypothetical protein
MGIAARRLALEHIDCNVSLELYNDTCLCLQCNDCDVIITNFGPACITDDDPRPKPSCAIGILVAVSDVSAEGKTASGEEPSEEGTPTPPLDTDSVCEELAVIDDFNKKFYESDNGQINEGDENEDIGDNDWGLEAGRSCGRKSGDNERISERNVEAAGGTCYFGKPPDDTDSGSPSEPDESD